MEHLKTHHSHEICANIVKKGHIADLNTKTHRHAISAEIGAYCSLVTDEWPKEDGTNIDIGPYEAGYIRVIDNLGRRNGLFMSKRKRVVLYPRWKNYRTIFRKFL